MMTESIYVIAKLKLYTTENGGRRTPIHTGYRPNHVFEYKENSKNFVMGYMGEINFDIDKIYPGETAKVEVNFLDIGSIKDFLTKGRTWWIHEGPRVIGKATVLELIHIEN
jgi:translation elongation factor EF-Tu-like GTPase